MKDNISKLHNCYGCGVCVKVCPVKIISLIENEEGFYIPKIYNEDKCIECGLCLKVCAFNHKDVDQANHNPKGFAAWSNNEIVREWCSSGGIGFEIGKKLISEGFIGVGVRFDTAKNRAEHFIATTIEEFMPSVGSKYIPSFTTDAFDKIDKKSKYLVTGTPCQIDSFRRFIKHFKIEENFILLDFFCHGVPSLLLWDKYIFEVKNKIGDISFVSWRNKRNGWHDSWSMNADSQTTEGLEKSQIIDWKDSYNLNIREKKHFYASRLSQGDLFYNFFLGNYCLNTCCYKSCKYKICNSAADIRIGDLWGKKYKNDKKGVSAVLAFTMKGLEILDLLYGESCTLIKEDISTVTEGQMPKSPKLPWIRKYVIRAFKSKDSLLQIDKKYLKIYKISRLPQRVTNRICKLTNIKPIFR